MQVLRTPVTAVKTEGRKVRAVLRAIAVMGLAACVPTALTGCGLISPSAPAADPRPSGRYEAVLPPSTVVAGVCLDGTRSTIPTFAKSERSILARTVRTWVPLDVAGVTEREPVPGLHLVIRRVGTRSYSTVSSQLVVRVTAVPGLRPRPQPTTDSFVSDHRAWRAARKLVEAAHRRAVAQARAAARAVRHAARFHRGPIGGRWVHDGTG